MWKLNAAALAVTGLCSAGPALAGDVHGLVVGINEYQHLDDLRGAVNDAELIAATLRGRGAKTVVTLIDAQASRAAIMDNFKALNAAARPGDWIIFTYAGHGGQEPEALPGDEPDDGKDETLLLPGFDTADGAGERIRDNDLYALFKAVKPGVKVLFLADSCHSGTISRPFDPRGAEVSYRQSNYGLIAVDPLERPGEDTRDANLEALGDLVVVSAALDSQKAPELLRGGEWHGATSVHLAEALSGAADLNADGSTTLEELRSYLVNGVQLMSESRQTPTVAFLPGRERDGLPFGGGNPPAPPSAALPTLSVFAEGGTLPAIEGAVPAADRATADLVWDAVKGELVAVALGDLVAMPKNAAELAGAVQKWRALAAIKAMAGDRPLAVTVGPKGPGALYTPPGQVDVTVAPRGDQRLRYITIFNLSAAGEVQGLFPWDRNPLETGPIPPGDPVPLVPSLSVVGPSFGAEHIVVIATADPPDALRRALAEIYELQNAATGAQQGRVLRAAAAVPGLLAAHLAPGDYAIGIAGLYTRETQDF